MIAAGIFALAAVYAWAAATGDPSRSVRDLVLVAAAVVCAAVAVLEAV